MEIKNEYNYIVFVLGYDLLHKFIMQQDEQSNDIVYKFCSIIANKFMLSAEYKQYNMSMYDCLVKWIKNNMNNIEKIWKDVN